VSNRRKKGITGMKGILYTIGIGSLILMLTAPAEPAAGTVPLSGALSHGQRYKINFVDVDGHSLSTAEGHVTLLVLMTPEDREKSAERWRPCSGLLSWQPKLQNDYDSQSH